MKILLMPDSYKGNLSAQQVCALMERAARALLPDADIRSIPVADGGEGMAACYLSALPGEAITCRVRGPEGDEVEATYALLHEGRTAVIEMAAAAGLSLAPRREVERNSTYGVGQLIADAASRGVGSILLGLGGSATNDGGCGMAAALGAVFTDAKGRAFVPAGLTLGRVANIDLTGLLPALKGIDIVAACDVDNPLCGSKGAAHVFGRQKGALTHRRRAALDGALRHLADRLEAQGLPVANLPGAGAAGGMGAGVVAFLGGRLVRGIDAMLDTVEFESIAADADLILTGEGKLDAQSLQGKVVLGIARRAKPLGVPVVAIVGDVAGGIEPAYAQGLTAAFSINRVAVDKQAAKARSRQDLEATTREVLRLWLAGKGN